VQVATQVPSHTFCPQTLPVIRQLISGKVV
jgi:hypothetical protein